MARFFQPKKKTQIDKKHQPVKIDRLDNHGAGIAYLNKKPLFVEGALPEETVLVQLAESKSKFARGNLIKVLEPSALRRDPFCQHYRDCGGCHLQHMDLNTQLEYKQQSLKQLMSKFARKEIGNEIELEPAIQASDKGYRRRTRISLIVDKKTKQLQFGFRKKQSKQIVNIKSCPVLEPSLNALLSPLKSLLSELPCVANLGHVEIVKADNTAILVVRHLKALDSKSHQALLDFASEHALTLYLQPESDKLERVVGDAGYYQEAGAKVPFEPNNFIQVNQDVNRQMVEQALEWLAPQAQDRVLDLFCGLGNFSLPLAKQVGQVVGVEGVDDMVRKATNNAKENGLDNAKFYQANLELDMSTQPWAEEKFDKVLLDPARAGAAGIVDQISELGAMRVVYVSCNPATLARDAQSLLSQGYQLEKLGMLDMFPHTSHMESMALFTKS